MTFPTFGPIWLMCNKINLENADITETTYDTALHNVWTIYLYISKINGLNLFQSHILFAQII